jgi:radical SAM family uncharacterized protein
MYEEILLQVNKPARYIGYEWNIPKKDFDNSYIKFALSFPDLYEVGMSNLGLRIIYGILNDIPDVTCERFFACNDDMERMLRANQKEILSLESRRRLKDFDLIGFSLGSELDYTNVLNILDLGHIPLQSSLRDSSYPLVIGGGPCSLNPEPLHEFFDLFVIGEAEELILELIDVYRNHKEEFRKGRISKQDLFFILAQIKGVYVPSLYEVTYGPEGKIKEFKPKSKNVPSKVKKRFIKDLNAAYFPLDWLIPYIQTIHDRLTLEIMRGCPNRCRFCQARSQYFPFRQRSIHKVVNLAEELYKRTGYEEISLVGLSVSDCPGIEEIAQRLIDLFKPKGISVSLPSIKPRAIVGRISSLISTVKKTGLTFAPEAGSRKLRDVLAKDFDEVEFFSALKQAYASGYRHVKLYFMIGLPYEEEEDLDGIVEFATRASELRREIKKIPAEINLSINTLIPKPHTPLQWFPMHDLDSIGHKQAYLKNKIRDKRLKLTFHNRYMSFLEGVLACGDRRLSPVILEAFRKGARFDAWSNHFGLERWLNAFKQSNIDPRFYLKEKLKDDFLAWDFIDVEISREALFAEFQRI